jgi:hypothetical protein
MYRPASTWKTIYATQTTEGIPPPNELADESEEVVNGYVERIDRALTTLRDRLVAYNPHVIVVLGYDDGTSFSNVQVPQFSTFTGAEFAGSTAVAALHENPADHQVSFRGNPEFAWEVHQGLVDAGFDMNYMSILNPLGRPEMGISSAFTYPGIKLLKDLDIPLVPIFINCGREPKPTAHRVIAFGSALGEILEESPGRVALLAVGGLSHDPNGDRAGWVDDRLDRWVLQHLGKGDTNRLRTLYDVDSDTVRGGTGQIRTWLAAGAAAERKVEITTAPGPMAHRKKAHAVTVDYIPALSAMTGLGFAYWDLP